MIFNQKIYDSILKGVGKSIGTLAIFGIVGSIWYITSNFYNTKYLDRKCNCVISNKDKIDKKEDKNEKEEKDKDDKEDKEDKKDEGDVLISNIDSFDELSDMFSEKENKKYKKIFEKLVK